MVKLMQAPSTPGTSTRMNLNDVKGSLMYITVHEHVKGMETAFGPADPVRCTVAILDGTLKGEVYTDTLIFPKVLAGQLAGFAGKQDPTVLARLGQGVAKPGKSAPWVLQECTPEDNVIGQKYETYTQAQTAQVNDPF